MPKIAYLSSTFPALSTTFVQYEVRILEKLGLEIVLTANRAPDPGRYHPEDDDLIGRTSYLTPVNPFRYLKANFSFFIKSPRRYLRGIKQALALKDDYPWQRTRNLAQLAGAAISMARYIRGLKSSIDVLKTLRDVKVQKNTRRTPYEGVPSSVPAGKIDRKD